METTINLRTRTLGFGYETQPTGHGSEIEIPQRPYYTGTYRQVVAAIQADRTYQSLRSGGTFVNTAWFIHGQRIIAIRLGGTWFDAWASMACWGEDELREGLRVRTASAKGRPCLLQGQALVRISATVLPAQAQWLRSHGGSATVRRLLAQAIDLRGDDPPCEEAT